MELNWISVKDRLPEKEKDVLLLFNYSIAKEKEVSCFRYIRLGFLEDGYSDPNRKMWYTDDGICNESSGRVTHWLEFPDPPKEGRQ